MGREIEEERGEITTLHSQGSVHTLSQWYHFKQITKPLT